MCGIVGYIGKEDAREVILQGLRKLEYRGYDSAGIALYNPTLKQYDLYKETGRVARLEAITANLASAPCGIGHTRWATHGRVNRENAHPHCSKSGRFMMVHNGVIENYHHLRDDYFSDHVFESDTDTEVIVQLIELFSETMDVEKALIKTLNLLKGSYAILLLDKHNPCTLYAAKHKSPLIIGKGDGAQIIASDLMAMTNIAEHYHPLEDGTVVVLNASSITFFDLSHQAFQPTFAVFDFEAETAELGLWPHYMIKEIMDQPAVIRRIISEYYEGDQLVIDPQILKALRKADRIHVLAAGTSMHAGYVAKTLFEKFADKPLEVHIASEFAYHPPVLSDNAFFIMISQSGETADLRACLTHLKPKGYETLTVTNVKTSTLAREATYVMEIFAGVEIAVASTKAYVAQIAVLSLLAAALSDDAPDMKYELAKISQAMEILLADPEVIHKIATDTLIKRNCFYIGRGIDYPVCLEAALKLKEISYIQTEGFAAGELKHGTIALIEDRTPVIALITDKKTALNTRSNLNEVKSRGALTIVISMEGLDEIGDTIVLGSVYPLLTSMISVVPTQLLAYYAALDRGLDIDKPRNLAKSVTVE